MSKAFLVSLGIFGISNCNSLDNDAQALALLEKQLEESVRAQSLADVPLGAFLSGGVDLDSITEIVGKLG